MFAMSHFRKTRFPPRSLMYCSKTFSGSPASVDFSKMADGWPKHAVKPLIFLVVPLPPRFFAPCPIIAAKPVSVAAPAVLESARLVGLDLGTEPCCVGCGL